MCKNRTEIAGNGIADDDNGYIDDVFGIDTLTRNEDGQASGNPMASHAHGTHVSGTIAAAQNNSKGIAGLSSTAQIMAIRTVPDAADETDIDIVESFIYAAKHGAKLINCSFGKRVNEGGDIVNETITFIGKEYGVLTVAAAGNDSSNNDKSPKYPASFDSDYLLVVASTNKRGSMSYFSNYGQETVDIAAPGSSVYSTVPGNDYQSMSGTSMAAPTTVGVASEVLGIFPELGPLKLKEVLMKSSTQVSKFKNKTVSGGRVDLANAVKYTLENYINL
jgi:subtilisin family serine protease